MAHVNQPYLWGDTWNVVITETGITSPRSRNLEVIPCADRYMAWVFFRFESAHHRQENRTEDVTGRLPFNARAFWDWRKALMLPKPQFKEFPAMGKTGGMTPPESATKEETKRYG